MSILNAGTLASIEAMRGRADTYLAGLNDLNLIHDDDQRRTAVGAALDLMTLQMHFDLFTLPESIRIFSSPAQFAQFRRASKKLSEAVRILGIERDSPASELLAAN